VTAEPKEGSYKYLISESNLWEKCLFDQNSPSKAFAAAKKIANDTLRYQAMETIASICLSRDELPIADMAAQELPMGFKQKQIFDRIQKKIDLRQLQKFFAEGKISDIAFIYQRFPLSHPYDQRLEQIVEAGIKNDQFNSVIILLPFVLHKKPELRSFIDKFPPDIVNKAIDQLLRDKKFDKALVLCTAYMHSAGIECMKKFIACAHEHKEIKYVIQGLTQLETNLELLIQTISTKEFNGLLLNLSAQTVDDIMNDLLSSGHHKTALVLLPYFQFDNDALLQRHDMSKVPITDMRYMLMQFIEQKHFYKAIELIKLLKNSVEEHNQWLCKIIEECRDIHVSKMCSLAMIDPKKSFEREVKEISEALAINPDQQNIVMFPKLLEWSQKAIMAAKNGEYGDEAASIFAKPDQALEDMSYVLRLTFVEWLRESGRIEEVPEIANPDDWKFPLEQLRKINRHHLVKMFTNKFVSPEEEQYFEAIRKILNLLSIDEAVIKSLKSCLMHTKWKV
jgi:hypothetical protein